MSKLLLKDKKMTNRTGLEIERKRQRELVLLLLFSKNSSLRILPKCLTGLHPLINERKPFQPLLPNDNNNFKKSGDNPTILDKI